MHFPITGLTYKIFHINLCQNLKVLYAMFSVENSKSKYDQLQLISTMGTGSLSQWYSGHVKALTTHSHLALRLKQEYSYNSTPPLGLYDMLYGKLSLYYFSQYDQPLHRYECVNDTRKYTVLCSISSYKPPTGLVLSMTYVNPSYLKLVLLHRPGL